jgi:tRNA threonylcarbamoyladenosine biosynthesis protein TsaE
MKKYISKSPDETRAIGFQVGGLLKPGDVVGLYGELGAGKTVLAQGIGTAFGIEQRQIVSASFTVISEYDTTPPFIHIDLYRINNESELTELGLREYVGGKGISIIEWAEKAEGELPEDLVKIHLQPVGNDIREIIIEGMNGENRDNQ